MGGNLTIFNKDHDTAEEGRSLKVLAAKHTASLQLPYAVGGNQARLDARTEFIIFGALAKGELGRAPDCKRFSEAAKKL